MKTTAWSLPSRRNSEASRSDRPCSTVWREVPPRPLPRPPEERETWSISIVCRPERLDSRSAVARSVGAKATCTAQLGETASSRPKDWMSCPRYCTTTRKLAP